MKQKTNPYNTPEGYFEHLEIKLSAIPEQMSGVSTMDRLRPYIALAAAFLFIVTCGTALLRRTAVTREDQEISTLDKIQLADMVPVTEPDLIYQTTETEELTTADITAYLIYSGTTLEHIEYYEQNE